METSYKVVKCLDRLFERALRFKCKDYWVTLDLNNETRSVNMMIWKKPFNTIIGFYFYYDDELRVKNFEKLIEKIISLLDEIEKNGCVKGEIKKLRNEEHCFVNINEFINMKR